MRIVTGAANLRCLGNCGLVVRGRDPHSRTNQAAIWAKRIQEIGDAHDGTSFLPNFQSETRK